MPKNEFIVSTHIPQFMRYIASFIALVVILIAGWQFIWALRNFSAVSIFFCLITGTGVVMGAKLLHTLLTSFNEEWTIKRKIILIKATRGDLTQNREIISQNITEYNILERSSDNGPDTYVIELNDNLGNKFISPHFTEKNDAQNAIDLFFSKA